MSHQYGFEKLEVWKLSKNFVKEIYFITNIFPKYEKYGLASQLNRASVSISANIAEGSSRTSVRDQAHFYQISYSSCMEVICLLLISLDLNYIDQNKYHNLRINIEEITNKINALRNYRINSYSPKHLNNSTTKQLQDAL